MANRIPRLLIVEDDESAQFAYADFLTESGYELQPATTLAEARTALESVEFDAALIDLRMPDGNGMELVSEIRRRDESMGIIVLTAVSDVTTAVNAMRSGADNFLTKPVDMEALQAALSKLIEVEHLRRRERIQRQLQRSGKPYFGTSDVMQKVIGYSSVAAGNDSVILLQGETGTGKGVLARWIHERSARSGETFVELNCSSLKGELLRSELFGHVKGSFTSAIRDRVGLVEAADHGTLFLDEIGDMDADVQAQLLKTIEEKSFRRVGENRLRRSDFRLICASNRDLLTLSREGVFRKDLYYRICVFPIHIPPLRERPADIPGLIEHFLAELGHPNPMVSTDLRSTLLACAWPGNIRELRDMLERAVLLADGKPLEPSHFPGLREQPDPDDDTTELADLDEIQRRHIQRVLDHFSGDKHAAAQVLGISVSSLYRRLEKARQEE